MLKVVPLTQELFDKAGEIKDDRYGHYDLPDPNKVIFRGAVIDNSESLVAIGIVPLLAEAIIVTDSAKSIPERAKAIRLLLDQFKIGVSGNLDGIHAFIQDPDFSKFLQKRFGFRKCKGEMLYLEV